MKILIGKIDKGQKGESDYYYDAKIGVFKKFIAKKATHNIISHFD